MQKRYYSKCFINTTDIHSNTQLIILLIDVNSWFKVQSILLNTARKWVTSLDGFNYHLVKKYQKKIIWGRSHNFFTTLLQGSKIKTMVAGHPCCIQTKVYRLYGKITKVLFFLYSLYVFFMNCRKNTINGHFFYVICIFFGGTKL